MADSGPTWYIGNHESKRVLQVSEQTLREAHDANYDMITTPITTPHFQSNVQALLSSYYSSLEDTASAASVAIPLIPPLKPADTPLAPTESIGQFLATTSSWIDLASSDAVISNVSRQIFNLEVAYAAFCGVQTVIVQGPLLSGPSYSPGSIAQFGRSIQEALSIGPYLQLHILLPLMPADGTDEDPAHLSSLASTPNIVDGGAENGGAIDPWRSWEAWDLIRTVTNFNPKVSVALSFSSQLPPIPILSRWFSEPLRIIVIPKSCFKSNHYEQPVLSRAHKTLLSSYMRLRTVPWLLLSDVEPVPSTCSPSLSAALENGSSDPFPSLADSVRVNKNVQSVRKDPTPHLSYLRYLQRNQPQKTMIERFGAGYQDFLQAPLQPLADNLESITYEVFEKDPVKYDWYERAIMHALVDWSAQGKSVSSASGAVVVAVVGAGRGPLVTRALRAARLAQVEVEVWAVEKNPNAYVFLQRSNEALWERKVTVLKSDMRFWQGPTQPDGSHGLVDILVSELLGSFADNELSPECLDGVQHVLNPTHGISIPASYSAHLTPIAAPRIHADLQGKSQADKAAFDVPYVVMLHAFDFLAIALDAHTPPAAAADDEPGPASPPPPAQDPLGFGRTPDVQTCWRFDHPAPAAVLAQARLRRGGGAAGGGGGQTGGDGANDHNTRFCSLSFRCAARGVCHGLAGYFETVLYRSSSGAAEPVELSTNPVTMDAKSKDMISWFPIFFPLRTPLAFPDDSELCVSMWRCSDDRKVWYEWLVTAFVVLPGGGRVRIGCSELHSSRKNGCLM